MRFPVPRWHFRFGRPDVMCLPRALTIFILSSRLCGAAQFSFFEPIQPPRPFQVMVHRGAANQAPENTRPALQRCIEDGFEWAEVDVRLTKDGQHVLSHRSEERR